MRTKRRDTPSMRMEALDHAELIRELRVPGQPDRLDLRIVRAFGDAPLADRGVAARLDDPDLRRFQPLGVTLRTVFDVPLRELGVERARQRGERFRAGPRRELSEQQIARKSLLGGQ